MISSRTRGPLRQLTPHPPRPHIVKTHMVEMSFAHLVSMYIEHARKMMEANSEPEAIRQDSMLRQTLEKIRAMEQRPGFPSAEEARAYEDLKAWEAEHGIPAELS